MDHKLKGSFHRIVSPPGYHIKPKYDLHGLRKRMTAKAKKDEGALPLTSMIDMFSILVIFLLMNFSSTGEIFFISKNMTLPGTKHSHAMESKPLLSITEDRVIFDAKEVGENPIHLEESDQELPRLRSALQQVKAFEQSVRPNQEFKGEVNIQADEKTPIIYIKRVMNTLIAEGWTGIHFATRDIAESEALTEGP